MPLRPVPRRLRAAPCSPAAACALFVSLAGGLGACDRAAEHDPAAAERAAVRDAASRAAALAVGDSAAADSSAREGSDSGARPRVALGVGRAGALVRGGDPPLGTGDVRIMSTDGALVMALVGDTVRLRAGDSLVVRLRREVAAEADTSSGLGGFVSRTVKGAVGGALAEAARFAVRVPVADIDDLRYEDGELRIGSDRGRRGRDGHGTLGDARFARADAERFIAAVRARQRALGVRPAGG